MFKVGDRVYYKDNGPDDAGTVLELIWEQCPHCKQDIMTGYKVKFDEDDDEPDTYTIGQLCLEGQIPNEPLYECEE